MKYTKTVMNDIFYVKGDNLTVHVLPEVERWSYEDCVCIFDTPKEATYNVNLITDELLIVYNENYDYFFDNHGDLQRTAKD